MSKKKVNKKSKAYKRRRRRRVVFGLELVVLLILGAALFGFAYFNSKLDKMQDGKLDFSKIGVNKDVQKADKNQKTGTELIALAGLDTRDNSLGAGSRSDTMMIACVNHDEKTIRLVSLYRDTWLNVFARDGWDKFTKCNAAYEIGGPEQMITMMNKNLDLDITDYATVDFKALSTAIEDLGGLDIDLTRAEIVHVNNYNKETSKVSGVPYKEIELPSKSELDGAQTKTFHLNGTQSVSYARIRKGDGADFRRAARQRLVLSKLMDKAKGASLPQLNSLMDSIFPLVKTSLTKQEIIKLGQALLTYNLDMENGQLGFPIDHMWGEPVKKAMNGNDCVVPVTLETNVEKLHDFIYPGINYEPSAEVKEYSDHIIKESGYGENDIPKTSENGALPVSPESN